LFHLLPKIQGFENSPYVPINNEQPVQESKVLIFFFTAFAVEEIDKFRIKNAQISISSKL
jgi:hypothetical protein